MNMNVSFSKCTIHHISFETSAPLEVQGDVWMYLNTVDSNTLSISSQENKRKLGRLLKSVFSCKGLIS